MPQSKDWYKISVEALRGWAVFLSVLILAGLGYFGYRYLEHYFLQREAATVIDDARVLLQRLQNEEGLGSFRGEYDAAWGSLQQARASYAEGDYAGALAQGRRSRTLLASILDALRHRGAAGEAQFIAVHGGVEFRRGERGEWEGARSRVVLRSGDYVKTAANGSAEIMFVDGTLYTVRPNTLFLVTRSRAPGGLPGEQTIEMEYGWVNLNTAQRSSKVTTPGAEARVDRESEAVVAYDQGSQVGRFAAYTGGLEVASQGGASRRVGALEQVVQRGDRLSDPEPLPDRPALLEPVDNFEVSMESQRRLTLRWEEVAGAAGYALQVADNRLFVDNVIEDEDRAKSSATLGLRDEGTFLWRVAAYADGGLRGPWSAPRSFRVSSRRSGVAEGDKTPPPLELQDITSYGSIFIIGGKTEPGAELTINGEPVTVEADGSFTKTIQLSREGWSFVEVRALDPGGNETVRRHRVFVESL